MQFSRFPRLFERVLSSNVRRYSNAAINGMYTTNALRRWSCQDKTLPPVEQISAIHIYDFDNTLFSSPLPSKVLWTGSTCGQLQAQEFLHNGGWWHNPAILAAVGKGIEVEEPRAWEGCWNESIVDLIKLSMSDPDALCVLLTGRAEAGFGDLIGRMVASKGLEFDMVSLKPIVGPDNNSFGSTMLFKQALLKDIVYTYRDAKEIRVYEDRVKHVKGFRDFFTDFNKTLMAASGQDNTIREPINAEIIQVNDKESLMDPTTEVAEVQRMINTHNQAILDGTAPPRSISYKIKKTVYYTGYLIDLPDIEKLKTLVKVPAEFPEHELKPLANSILITPKPAPADIMATVGGLGAKMSWRVTGVANHENRVWAARVAPAVPGTAFYTENRTPCVVLATRRQAKPVEAMYIRNWQPVPPEQAFAFETEVGEKMLLRIEHEIAGEDEYESSFPHAKNAKKHPRDEDFPALGSSQLRGNAKAPRPQQRSQQNGYANAAARGGSGIGFAAQRGGTNPRGGRGMSNQAGNFRGRGRGGGQQRGGRGRGAYRSLDDNVGQGYSGGSMQY